MRYEYRVWDKTKEVMRDVVGIHFPSNIVECMPNSKDEFMWEMYNPFLFDGEHELMQYTGLKDKDGVRIYRGDVIEDSDKERHVITFKNGGFGREGRFLIDYNTGECIVTHEPLINSVIDGCKVIGNIYENKELLEGI